MDVRTWQPSHPYADAGSDPIVIIVLVIAVVVIVAVVMAMFPSDNRE